MNSPFSQRDIGYTIISRIEELIRQVISEKLIVLFGAEFLKGIPEGIIQKINNKVSDKQWEEPLDFLQYTDFPDLKEIICFKLNYEKCFSELFEDKNVIQPLFAELYTLRCKIDHVRGYFTSTDLDILLSDSYKISVYLKDFSKEFNEFITIITKNPEKVVIPIATKSCVENIFFTNVPNNLPVPDYEYEGGFVGRSEDIKSIINMIEGSKYPVITLSGAGGVGKTALALKVVEKILENDPNKYDGIIWLSAKEQFLSYLGIEDLEPTIKNYEELLDKIVEVMDFGPVEDNLKDKEAAVNTIIELVDKLLIIVDNLETITDERIKNFIIEANPKIKILITSRKGLGQVERRYDLKQLKEKEAIYMFRQISKDKKLDSLAKLDDNVIRTYVKKVSCYPLSIKWVIGKVALGKDINDVINSIDSTTSDISLFCFEQIFSELSINGKKILFALSQFDETPSAGVLKYMVNLETNEFEDGVRELILVSFVIPEQFATSSGEISSKFSLLTLTRGYVRQQLDKNIVVKRELNERLYDVRSTIEETERAKKQYRFNLSDLGANTEEEKIAALITRTAYQKYTTGRYIEALEDYKRAASIAPNFANVYRNWAFVESEQGHIVEAEKLMQKAVHISPEDPSLWLVWGNMRRKHEKIKEALPMYEKAYKLLPNDGVVLNSLGQAKTRLGCFEEADELYKKALEVDKKNQTVRHEIVNRTSLSDNLRRWAEEEVSKRNYKSAEQKLVESLKQCLATVRLDDGDQKSRDLLRSIWIDLGQVYAHNIYDYEKATKCFRLAIVKNPQRYNEVKDSVIASYNLAKLLYKNGYYEEALSICSPKYFRSDYLRRNQGYKEKYSKLLKDIKNSNEPRIEGKIVFVNNSKNYSLIESMTAPNSTYFGHINDFEEDIDRLDDSLIGLRVNFCQAEDENLINKGKQPEAKKIKIIN